MSLKKRFSAEQEKQIENAVAQAEKMTSGEIVPMIVANSSNYYEANLILAFLGFLVASVLLLVFPAKWGETREMAEIFLFQGVGLLVGLLFSLIRPLKRTVIGKKRLSLEVNQAVFSNFLTTGLTNTRDRTGILIYISLFERRAVILADSGINNHVQSGYWDGQVAAIIDGVKNNKLSGAIENAILQIGDKLAEKFPPRSDDTDELSNKVRTERTDV